MRHPLFATPPAGPDPASWVAAGSRALHPVRWALGLVGLVATVAAAAIAQTLFDRQAPRFTDWFTEPGTQAVAFAEQLADRSVGALVVRFGPVVAVVAGVWGLIGGWIARHELLARHRGQPYATSERIEPGPTALVARRPKDLVLSAPMVLALCGLVLAPVALAGALNHLGGIGAILVAVLLPVVLLANLILLLLVIGAVAWPLMPVTIAAECSDTFDALSRAYNYTYTRPARFAVLLVVTLAASALPVVGALFPVAGPVENWLSAAGHPAVWVAAALSASIFWSLQTLVYLHLRTSVDSTDANELAADSNVEAPVPAPTDVGQKKPAVRPAPAPTAGRALFTTFVLLGLMVGTWVVTANLFARLGGENAGWLGWGLGERFRPDADGLYYFASLLAAGWGLIWVTSPIVVAVYRRLRADDRPANPSPTT